MRILHKDSERIISSLSNREGTLVSMLKLHSTPTHPSTPPLSYLVTEWGTCFIYPVTAITSGTKYCLLTKIHRKFDLRCFHLKALDQVWVLFATLLFLLRINLDDHINFSPLGPDACKSFSLYCNDFPSNLFDLWGYSFYYFAPHYSHCLSFFLFFVWFCCVCLQLFFWMRSLCS